MELARVIALVVDYGFGSEVLHILSLTELLRWGVTETVNG
jgi:hypothetical protein